jgi:hypothetical protein
MVFVTGSFESHKNIPGLSEYSHDELKQLYFDVMEFCLMHNVRSFNEDWKDDFYHAFKSSRSLDSTVIDNINDYLVFKEDGINELELDYRFLLNENFERITPYQPYGLQKEPNFNNVTIRANEMCTEINTDTQEIITSKKKYGYKQIVVCGGSLCTPILLHNQPDKIEYRDDIFLHIPFEIMSKFINSNMVNNLPIRPEGWFFTSESDRLNCCVQFYVNPASRGAKIIRSMSDPNRKCLVDCNWIEI